MQVPSRNTGLIDSLSQASLGVAASIGFGRGNGSLLCQNPLLLMPLRPDHFCRRSQRDGMRRGSLPQWFLLLGGGPRILSGCQSLRDLERFALRHHAALIQALGLELRRPPTDVSTSAICSCRFDVAEDLPGSCRGWNARQTQVWRWVLESARSGGRATYLRARLSDRRWRRCVQFLR